MREEVLRLMKKKRFLGLLFSALFVLCGCGFQPVKYIPWWGPDYVGREFREELEEGNRLFADGDYESAETVFQNLQRSENPVVIRQALFGLACSRFMLAEDRQEYIDAIEVLELWQRISSTGLKREDPRMLLAVFPKALPSVSGGGLQDASPGKEHFLVRVLDYEKEMDDLEQRVVGLKRQIKELERQKGSIKNMEAAMKAMEKAMEASEETAKTMETELLKLREQIQTIETIDQEIREKKQGISSP
jgi:DNA repair exonuclease SbcCD ATPase subunit